MSEVLIANCLACRGAAFNLFVAKMIICPEMGEELTLVEI